VKNRINIGWVCIGAFILVIPIFMNDIIFKNNYPSTVSDDGWASFFGSYIGAILTLFGVVLTIKNLEKENKKASKENNERILKEKRLEVLPYLTVSLLDDTIPESYSIIPVGIKDFDINYNYYEKTIKLSIMNEGLGPACDLYCNIHIKNEQDTNSVYFTKLLPNYRSNLSNKCEKTFVFALPNVFDIKAGVEDYEILLVFFYKDIFSNIYYQELSGSILVDKYINGETEDQYAVHINNLEGYKQIDGAYNYSLPYWFKEEYSAVELVKKQFCDYSNAEEELTSVLSSKNHKMLQIIKTYLVNEAKKVFDVPHLDMGCGDFVGVKRIEDNVWESLFFEERAFNLNKKILFAIVVKVDLLSENASVTDIQILRNTLSDDKKLLEKYESFVKNYLKKCKKDFLH